MRLKKAGEMGIGIISTFIHPSESGCQRGRQCFPPATSSWDRWQKCLPCSAPFGMAELVPGGAGRERSEVWERPAVQSGAPANSAGSAAAAPLPGSTATFSVPRSGAEIFSSLPFKCSESLKLMLLHFDENNVFIIHLLFTWKM